MAIIKRKYRTKKQKKPVIYYQAEVFMKGVRIAVKNFSTKREAVLWHEEKIHEVTFSHTSVNGQMTFKVCVNRFLKEAETRMLISSFQRYKQQATHRSNPVYWRISSFMLLTGARVSEACGICWDALDLERGVARVVRRVRWDYWNKQPVLEEVTKTTQSARLLVLPKRLQDILLEIKKEAKSDLVFADQEGGVLKYNAIQSAFNAGFEALNLPWRSTHICRHTYATMLMGTNNLSAVQASLGHTQQAMTQRYAKALALLSSDIGEKTASILFKKAK